MGVVVVAVVVIAVAVTVVVFVVGVERLKVVSERPELDIVL